jgi:hypothetical protein
MCMVLYVAADEPLTIIPATEPPSAFSARPVQGPEEPIRAQFSMAHVYFLGAHEGCSCGFSYGRGDEDADVPGRESVRQLRAYLDAAVDRLGVVEVYSCWVDEEAQPAAERDFVTTSVFTPEAESFELPKGWFATVIAAAS